MGDISFRSQFLNSANDGVINKNELQTLRQTAAQVQEDAPGSVDAQVAEQLIEQIDVENTFEMGGFEYPEYDGFDAVEVGSFTITPTYNEADAIPGNNGREIISNISQSDALSSTNNDGHRCCTVMLNHLTRNGENFSDTARKVGLPANQRDLTYENYHRAQERLYDSVSPDNNGIEYTTNTQTDGEGNITSVTVGGEMARAASKLGINLEALHGPTEESVNQRSGAVNQFFSDNPNGSLLVNVTLDPNTGDLGLIGEAGEPHYVMVFKEGDQYYLNNTGVLNNGDGSAVTAISEAQMRRFTNSEGAVFGLSN